MLQSFSHPNIIQCYGTYVDESNDSKGYKVFIVMEKMEFSLSEYMILRGGTITAPDELSSILSQCLIGLQYIHGQGTYSLVNFIKEEVW